MKLVLIWKDLKFGYVLYMGGNKYYAYTFWTLVFFSWLLYSIGFVTAWMIYAK